MGHSSKMFKSAHMPIEEGFLLACWEGHDKRSAGIGQMHHKHVDLLLHPIQDHLSLAPVHLAVLTWLKLERQKGGWPFMGLAPANCIHLHARLTSRVPLGLE